MKLPVNIPRLAARTKWFWPLFMAILACHGPSASRCVKAAKPSTGAQFASVEDTMSGFSIHSCPGGPEPSDFTLLCVSLREEIREKWFGRSLEGKWEPPCEIFLHGTRSAYVRAVGAGAGQTSGSSFIEQSQGRIVCRRIDLLVAQDGTTPALAHELTHVVLADWFPGHRPPPWLDEGIALLADSPQKRALHQRNCREALRNGTAYHLADLMAMDRLASPRQFAAFYGQSESLVSFLVVREKPTRLLEFARQGSEKSYDQALRDTYGIDGVSQLEHLWLQSAARRSDMQQAAFMTAVTVQR